MEIQTKIPFYAKIALIFVGLFAFVYTMYIGQRIIIPLLYSTIIAILLNPIVNFLVARKVNKVIAIFIAVILAISVVFGFFLIISSQISMFSENLTGLQDKFGLANKEFTEWLSDKFNLRQYQISDWIKENKMIAFDNISIGEKISQAGRMFFLAMLLPVYVFMILYYKTLLLEFIRKLFRIEHHLTVVEVLGSTKKIIQGYLTGLFFEMLIVAFLNSIGLLILGIPYAIILGITGAIVNIIPYIGGIIAIVLPMVIAFVTKDSLSSPIMVLVVYVIIQFIDNHYIIPNVVAKRVQLNALISIIVVLVGGALWGIPGMFISIPLTAIIKVICDHIEPLKPWGFLLGNIVPSATKFSFPAQKKNQQ